VTVREWHPAGVISSLKGGRVQWENVSFMSVNELLVLTAVAYPAFLVAILFLLTVLVGMLLTTNPSPAGSGGDAAAVAADDVCLLHDGKIRDPKYNPPVLPKERLSTRSRIIYNAWAFFCCLIPSLMVFGLPMVMICLAVPYPQEVFSALTLITSAFLFSNGLYMAIFAGTTIWRMRNLSMAAPDFRIHPGHAVREVVHWVILPQYKEDVEIVSMALQSIAESGVATSSICILLGMEEREGEQANEKAKILRGRFQDKFKDIQVSTHPANLPNDPAGKASNVAWAFKELMRYMLQNHQDMSKVILTVADADSEFHSKYFEHLSQRFLETSDTTRDLTIWQSPVFHIKNYHRQPAPVIVGTMFTCMQEMACQSDPNSVRLPYSTYSLSLGLARSVGGWDPDWIAEDYHMGIKCFLLTLGRALVEPILLPTVNYTPEENTWVGTIWARWAQAKRHALGFSDMTYYFMMLPLIFGYTVTNKSSVYSMQAFWSMITYGTTLVIRLVNIHVFIGIMYTYGVVTTVLKFLMQVLLSDDRHIFFFFTRTNLCPQLLMASSLVCTVFVAVLFIAVYGIMVDRIENKPFTHSTPLHWMRNALAILCFGPFYFLGLGFCIWRAALSVIFSRSFEYEVAPKPTRSATSAADQSAGPGEGSSCPAPDPVATT